ncbi:MAG: ABC transporter substrate-binding protein, partial [Candidatus Omnitrophica bacterium]|nr:ABC transporter substrate-binding protein [Candidatus Omnitrophota bacterium]
MEKCKTNIYILIALLSFLSCAGCRPKPKEARLTRVSIAFQNWVGYGPLYLAQEKGFFKDEGIELVFIDEQLDAARGDALRAGMLDCEAGTI